METALKLHRIEALSLPGSPAKPNEDSFGLTETAACVFDGATGVGEQLMPGPSDAAWLAHFAARRFCAYAEARQGGLRDWVRAAAADAERSFVALRRRPPVERYEIPYASAVLTSLESETLRILWFGDCAVMLHRPDGSFTFFGDTIAKRDSERKRVERLSRELGRRPADMILRDEFIPALRTGRNYVNTDGDWLFAPDPQCADHAKTADTEVSQGCLLLLASDGFLALASDYERYSAGELFAAVIERGLQPLADELRAVEQADPAGSKYPRFKTSDDATALLLKVE